MTITKKVTTTAAAKKVAAEEAAKLGTNYPPDNHQRFCARCFRAHDGCPSKGALMMTPDKGCTL